METQSQKWFLKGTLARQTSSVLSRHRPMCYPPSCCAMKRDADVLADVHTLYAKSTAPTFCPFPKHVEKCSSFRIATVVLYHVKSTPLSLSPVSTVHFKVYLVNSMHILLSMIYFLHADGVAEMVRGQMGSGHAGRRWRRARKTVSAGDAASRVKCNSSASGGSLIQTESGPRSKLCRPNLSRSKRPFRS